MHHAEGFAILERACENWFKSKGVNLKERDKTVDEWAVYMIVFLKHYEEAKRGVKK